MCLLSTTAVYSQLMLVHGKSKGKGKGSQNNSNECALVHLPLMRAAVAPNMLFLKLLNHQSFVYMVSEWGIDFDEPLGLNVPPSHSRSCVRKLNLHP